MLDTQGWARTISPANEFWPRQPSTRNVPPKISLFYCPFCWVWKRFLFIFCCWPAHFAFSVTSVSPIKFAFFLRNIFFSVLYLLATCSAPALSPLYGDLSKTGSDCTPVLGGSSDNTADVEKRVVWMSRSLCLSLCFSLSSA